MIAVNGRVNPILDSIVSDSQKGFVPGKHIQDNGWFVQTAMAAKKRGTALVFLDFKGAYDTVDHELLLDGMAAKGFGPRIINMVRAGLSKAATRVKIGNVLSELIKMARGVRQGDPSATWEYDIICDIFVMLVEKYLSGVKLRGRSEKH